MSALKSTLLEQPLDSLFEAPRLPAYRLPKLLEELYGGPLGFAQPCLYANFVATIDGIVALEQREKSGTMISGGSPADRFVMGLLRGCAEAVVVGAGTFRATPKHRWTADHIFPALSDEFAELRRALGRTPQPTLVVVSGSGELDTEHPGLEGHSLVLTTGAGEARLRGRLPAGCELRALGEDQPEADVVMKAVRSEGFNVVLTEGGPSLLGPLIARRLLDELFLTVAPRLAGRATDSYRKSLVEGADVLGLPGASARLLSLRKHGSYLFLRYRLGDVSTDE